MTSRAILNGWPLGPGQPARAYIPAVTPTPTPTLTLTGPLSFTAGAASGTLVANIGNVPAGATPTLTPNDGRLVIAGDQASGWKVVVGLTASTAGTIALSVAAPGANGASASVTVNPAVPAAAYSMDFANSSYSTPSGAVADPFAAGLLTLARSTPLIVPDATGVYQTYAANVPALNSRGLWSREQARTNGLPNNSMTGAAANTAPTGWVETLAAAGITKSIVGTGTDTTTGLPYLDVSFSGTATAAGAYTLQMSANAAIASSSSDIWMQSVWLALQSGTLPIDGTTAVRVQALYINTVNTGQGIAQQAEDRLMQRDTTPRRIKNTVTSASLTSTQQAAIAYIKPQVLVNFKSGTTYGFTLRVICPMMEKVASINEDAGFPILTTNAAVTHQPDTIQYAGALLTAAQSSAVTQDVTTTHLRASGIDWRVDKPILRANGSIALLKRTAKGEIGTDLGAGATTYRGYRTHFDWTQKHRVQWTATKVRVASTGTGYVREAAGSVPAITSMAIVIDGCVQRIDLTTSYVDDVTAYTNPTVDVAVYGATSGGIAAAASAILAGKTALVIGGWRDANPGGMATGGLGAVDASVATLSDAFGAMSLDYPRYCNEWQGKTNLDTKSISSRVALRYFDYLIRKARVTQHYAKGVTSVAKTGTRITSISCTGGQTYTCKRAIDASYEGDLMAMAGVNFRVGREASDSNNPFNGNRGNQPMTTTSAGVSDHAFTPQLGGGYTQILNVDPWRTPATPASGLLPGVQSAPGGTVGATDGAIQAYCYRFTLTKDATRRVALPTTPPPGYDALTFELLGRYIAAITAAGWTAVPDTQVVNEANKEFNLGLFMIYNQTEGGSASTATYDMNANNGFSWDTFGANWGEGWAAIMTAAGVSSPSANYAVAAYAEREIFAKWQENFQRGMMYWFGYSGDSRIPAQIQSDARNLGLDGRSYLDPHENDQANWMYALYVREARAFIGDLVLEASDITATDGTAPRSLKSIGALSYSIDSHHVRRYADNSTGTWRTINEGNLFLVASGNKMAPVALEHITPKRAECTNIAITFACSARHTGFGALRMEMAHMQMSESAGILASLSIDADVNMQDVDYDNALRPAILARGIVAPQVN